MRNFASLSLALLASISNPVALAAPFDNTITNLIPDLYAALNIVSREQIGFIPSVYRDANLSRAALFQPIFIPIAPPAVAVDVVPAMVTPTPPDTVFTDVTAQLTKSRSVGFAWVGEQQRALSAGVGYMSLQANNIAEAMRTLVNEMERDIALEAANNASRAWGTAGVTPFATNLGDAAQLKKILDDNGAPSGERSLIIDSTANVNLLSLTQLTKVNEAGTTMTLRDGELLSLFGLSTKQSAGVGIRVPGTAASATTNAVGYAIGATVINLAVIGTGTFIKGDIVTFAGDTNKYVLQVGDSDVSNGGSIILAGPGLRVAIPAVATAITKSVASTGNVAFTRNSILFLNRAPAIPLEGDAATDRMSVQDPRSGIVFDVAIYPGYKMNRYEIAASWGVKAIKPAFIAALLG